MPTHLTPTRVFSCAGLVSSGTAVTGWVETGRPENALLLLNILAAGTSWSVALSTGTVSGAAGSSVSLSGAASVTGNTTGQFAYRLQNKLSKYTYYAVSGVGNPTVAATLVGQDYFNSAQLSAPSATAGIIPTEA